MKTKITIIAIILSVFAFSCKKETTTVNQFKFSTITGIKDGSSGTVTLSWIDSKNTNWKISVISPSGNIHSSIDWDTPQHQITNLELDSLYTITVTGLKNTSQSGSVNARIGTMGDVMVGEQRP